VVPSASGASAFLTFQKPASGRYEVVQTATIDQLLERSGFAKVDFLSLDIEGRELEALQGFSFERYQPALILMEDHFVTLEKHRFLRNKQYRLVDRVGYNQWYIPQDRFFPLSAQKTRWELFRKMYLSHPLRRLKFWLKASRRSKTLSCH
jgi:hypothetical protein